METAAAGSKRRVAAPERPAAAGSARNSAQLLTPRLQMRRSVFGPTPGRWRKLLLSTDLGPGPAPQHHEHHHHGRQQQGQPYAGADGMRGSLDTPLLGF